MRMATEAELVDVVELKDSGVEVLPEGIPTVDGDFLNGKRDGENDDSEVEEEEDSSEDEEEEEVYSDESDFEDTPVKKNATAKVVKNSKTRTPPRRTRRGQESPAPEVKTLTPRRRGRGRRASNAKSNGTRPANSPSPMVISPSPVKSGRPQATQIVSNSQVSLGTTVQGDKEKASMPASVAEPSKEAESLKKIDEDCTEQQHRERKQIDEDNASSEESDLEEVPLQNEIKGLDATTRKIFQYLQKTNRPYGPTDLSRALESLTRLQVNKGLVKLVNLGLVHNNEKKLHWLEQTLFGSTGPAKVTKLKAKLLSAGQKLTKKKLASIELKRAVAAIKGEPADSDLEVELAKVKKEVEHQSSVLKEKSSTLSNSHRDEKTKDLKRRAQVGAYALREELKFYKSAWRKRKDRVKEVAMDILENGSKKMKLDNFLDEIGIEPDNVQLKDIA